MAEAGAAVPRPLPRGGKGEGAGRSAGPPGRRDGGAAPGLISRQDEPALVGEIECLLCKGIIVVYYHYGYRGTRGRCPVCGVEFPLE